MISRILALFFLVASCTIGAQTPSLNLFIAPNGVDSNPGTMERPFGTMEKARDAVRELKRIKGLPPGGVIIWLRGGEYRRSMPLTLTAEDSGTESSPITWRAWQDEKVRITGGRAIGSWKPVSDPVTLDQMDPETRGKIFQADIKAQGITEYGDIGLDAAWEIQVYLARIDGQGEDSIGSAMASSEYVKSGRKVSPRLEVFFNDQPMELSRWPNDGFIKTEKVLGATEIDVRGVKGCKEGIFVYEGDRPNRWVKEKDPQNVSAMRGLAFCYLKRGDYGQAVGVMREATNIEGGNADNWMMLGRALVGNGNNEGAIRAFEKVAEINPNHADAKNALKILKGTQ